MAGTGTARARQNRLAPYLLVAPGIIWLIIFFVLPVATLAQTSMSVADGALVGATSEALSDYGAHFFRSLRYAMRRHADGAGARLSARLRHRLPRRPAQESAARAGDPSVLHDLPGPHLRLEDDPQRQRTGGRGCCRRSTCWRRADGCSTRPMAVLGGLTYNFVPFMILPIYVSLEKIDRRLVEAARGPLLHAAAGFLKVVLPLSLPGSSPAACSRSFRRRATSSTPSCSAAPTSR